MDHLLINGMSRGSTINDLGIVVGLVNSSGAALWSNIGGLVSLRPLAGGNRCEVNDINNNNLAVGRSHTKITDSNALDHATLWEGNDVVDLGTLPGGSWSSAYAINDIGWIVGCSGTSDGNTHATLWKPVQAVPEPATLFGFGVPMLMVGIGKLRGLRK